MYQVICYSESPLYTWKCEHYLGNAHVLQQDGAILCACAENLQSDANATFTFLLTTTIL